ncbi:hypothetical protein DFH07DRAFT_781751 [Mycena maculata]|uniref:Uncharacterized protein n=1 Tax=Mycena maculata TaxID=230809 RepID=A0AAD7MTL4_9AGAR|nr:hypothetical protein DFH07DRAFT_781751 [Mycena maculata]
MIPNMILINQTSPNHRGSTISCIQRGRYWYLQVQDTAYGNITDPFAWDLGQLLPWSLQQEQELARIIWLDDWEAHMNIIEQILSFLRIYLHALFMFFCPRLHPASKGSVPPVFAPIFNLFPHWWSGWNAISTPHGPREPDLWCRYYHLTHAQLHGTAPLDGRDTSWSQQVHFLRVGFLDQPRAALFWRGEPAVVGAAEQPSTKCHEPLMGIYGGIPILIRGVHVKGPMLQNMLQFMLQICCRGLVKKKKYGRGSGIVDGAPDSGAIEGGIDAIIGANGARARLPKKGTDEENTTEPLGTDGDHCHIPFGNDGAGSLMACPIRGGIVDGAHDGGRGGAGPPPKNIK